MAIPFVYNVRHVMNRPMSTLTTALGIGLTVAILIGALALASGFRASLVSTGRDDNAIVLRKGADSEISSGISRDNANIVRALQEIATGPDGRPLVTADLVVVTNRERLGQSGSSNVTVRGVDASAITIRGGVKITAGRMFTPGTDEVIIGRRIAGRFKHCAVGDRIRFQQRDFTVVGHFSSGGSAFESEVWGDVEVLMPALDRDNTYQTIVFRMRDPQQFPALKARLEADPRLQVQVQIERRFFAKQSELFTGLITGVGLFITIIMAVGALFGAANTMFAAIGSRTREIAMLLVLGFSPRAVMVSFMFESVLIAALGGVLGILMALPVNGITSSTTNFTSFSELAFQFQVTPQAMMQGMGFALALGLLGGFFPALRASRQRLSTALRGG
ncbi:MAG: ABC transporter permease [Candidatus Eisenbacteria bacterium]